MPERRRVSWSLAFLLLFGLCASGFTATAEEPQGRAAARELIREYIETCLGGGDLECLDRYWVEGKAERVRRGERLRRSLFPDLAYEVHEILVEGERVAARFTVTGTRSGSPPAGGGEGAEEGSGVLEVVEAAFYSLSEGRIVEGTLVSDRLPVSQALGYTLVPPQGGPSD